MISTWRSVPWWKKPKSMPGTSVKVQSGYLESYTSQTVLLHSKLNLKIDVCGGGIKITWYRELVILRHRPSQKSRRVFLQSKRRQGLPFSLWKIMLRVQEWTLLLRQNILMSKWTLRGVIQWETDVLLHFWVTLFLSDVFCWVKVKPKRYLRTWFVFLGFKP